MTEQLTQSSKTLWVTVAALFLIGFLAHVAYVLVAIVTEISLPSWGLHNHDGLHQFADQRGYLGIPNAANVLSNLPFAVFGLWGLQLVGRLMTQRRMQNFAANEACLTSVLPARALAVYALFFIGLGFTALGSICYHLAPTNASLLWDRLGMSVAFAGLLGIAVSERISLANGQVLCAVTLLAAALALWVWRSTGDVLPWGVLQFGGMAIVATLAFAAPPQATGSTPLLAVILCYALAKAFESLDPQVLTLTQQMVSGHTLKHLMAALAGWFVLKNVGSIN